VQAIGPSARWGSAVGLVLMGFLSGCKRAEPEPAPSSAPPPPKSSAPSQQPASSAQPAARVTWTRPAAWEERPPSSMRKASYRVPGKSGDAEVAVFYFGPSSGGGVEANIARWLAQFVNLAADGARRDRITVNGLTVSTVRVAEGTFASGMPGGPTTPTERWGLHAAVVETPSGAYFFKMTGPKDTVTAEEARFLEFLRSVKSSG
jgi:hypothetical protein